MKFVYCLLLFETGVAMLGNHVVTRVPTLAMLGNQGTHVAYVGYPGYPTFISYIVIFDIYYKSYLET